MTNVSRREGTITHKRLSPRQVVFERLYPAEYTSVVATRLSNALLVGERNDLLCLSCQLIADATYVGEIIGQITIGLLCDRVGRKAGLVFTTTLIVIGATLCTAARGAHDSVQGLFWFLTLARGITGVVG